MSGTSTKIAIALGAVTRDSVTALIVCRGLGVELPRVSLRTRSGDAQALTVERLAPGATIAPQLSRLDVSVYRVHAQLQNESTLEARNATGDATCRTAPFRALPDKLSDAAAGVSFVLATCVYHSAPDLQRFAATIRGQQGLGAPPAFALLAGDNVYLDVPKPAGQTPADVVDRYLTYFLDDGYMRARASMPAFSTYDDHEYWNDYPEHGVPVSLWLAEHEKQAFGAAAQQCLELFQRSLNPTRADTQLAYQIELPPVSIFVLDTRSQRGTIAVLPEQLLPEPDLVAFESWARQLRGPGLLVLGQPLWIEPIMKTGPFVADHNISYFQKQYSRICQALERAPYDVLICSGDVHYSRLLRITTRSRRTLHEVVSSPLISIPSTAASLRQAVLGGTSDPAREHEISDTTRPPFAGWHASYQTGTGVGTAFALINLKPAGSGVDVGVSFVDMRRGTAAPLVRHTALGEAELFRGGSGPAVCTHPSAFRLGPRLSV